jgi:SAM-dependent methyltransferase
MMPENAYHQVPYITIPMAQTHPDRLASVARLFGMTPAPAGSCRVLEIGCGNGGNLIPMAYRLAGSRFTGIDLAEKAVEEGRRFVGELALANLDLIAMDLCEIGPSMGEFDYIVAHGIYSWIPDELRDRLLDVCRQRLAPQGVALISYNALPGRYVRMMLREMATYHTRNCTDAGERIEQARSLLRVLGEAHLCQGAWQPMVEEEVQRTLDANDGWFFHDDLEPVNDSFYVHDFAARAARHSLQYLGDAQPHLMFDSRISLDWVGADFMEREQYFDFLSLRPFRQTLLCGAEVRLERPAGPEQMDRFLFSSPARRLNGKIEGLNSVFLVDPPEPVARVAAALGAAHPLPVAFDKLLESAADRPTLCKTLFTFISSGFAAFHTYDFVPAEIGGRAPRASRLARWENLRTHKVTYSNHTECKLDIMVRTLIELLDGTRGIDELATGLARLEGAPPLEDIREQLPHVLTHMKHAGLLE